MFINSNNTKKNVLYAYLNANGLTHLLNKINKSVIIWTLNVILYMLLNIKYLF
jgi:hypothetical protein